MARKKYVTLLPSGARTTTQNITIETPDHAGIALCLDLTAFVTAASLTVTVAGHDRIANKFWTILTGAAITANSTVIYEIYPGTDEVTNLSENAYLPYDIRVTVAHGNANSHTYSLTAVLLP